MEFKDQKLEEAWVRIKEEVKDKRQAQRDFRLHRSASQEMCRKYDEMKNEIQEFHSNRTGYIKRSEYIELMNKHDELKKQNQHQCSMLQAYKSQCGRFQLGNIEMSEQIENLE
jgi:hypothetical protein